MNAIERLPCDKNSLRRLKSDTLLVSAIEGLPCDRSSLFRPEDGGVLRPIIERLSCDSSSLRRSKNSVVLMTVIERLPYGWSRSLLKGCHALGLSHSAGDGLVLPRRVWGWVAIEAGDLVRV